MTFTLLEYWHLLKKNIQFYGLLNVFNLLYYCMIADGWYYDERRKKNVKNRAKLRGKIEWAFGWPMLGSSLLVYILGVAPSQQQWQIKDNKGL